MPKRLSMDEDTEQHLAHFEEMESSDPHAVEAHLYEHGIETYTIAGGEGDNYRRHREKHYMALFDSKARDAEALRLIRAALTDGSLPTDFARLVAIGSIIGGLRPLTDDQIKRGREIAAQL